MVAPSSLVKNWANEFEKWLHGRLPALAIDSGSKDEIDREIEVFFTRRDRMRQQVLVISYETYRLHAYKFTKPVGILICDEGHRLKNADSLTYQALAAMNTRRRIILSGRALAWLLSTQTKKRTVGPLPSSPRKNENEQALRFKMISWSTSAWCNSAIQVSWEPWRTFGASLKPLSCLAGTPGAVPR